MNISADTYNGWIHLQNKSRKKEISAGFWITYRPCNIEKHNKNIVETVKGIIHKENLIGGQIEDSFYDIVALSTSVDRWEIYRVKMALMNALNINEDELYWISKFESRKPEWIINDKLLFNDFKKTLLRFRANHSKRSEALKEFEMLKLSVYKILTEEKIMNRDSMVVKPIFNGVNYNINPELVFVLMPFTEKWSDDIYMLLRNVCENLSLTVMRADDFLMPNIIMDDIWRGINEAGIIIADITVHNANVFYELGIAHTIGKDVILIRGEDGVKSPFDISPWRYVDYKLNPIGAEKFKNDLNDILGEYKRKNGI